MPEGEEKSWIRLLLERIDERVLALREGVERLREMIDDHERRLTQHEMSLKNLLRDDHAGLRRIIREEQVRAGVLSKDDIKELIHNEAEVILDKKGSKFRDWGGWVFGLIATAALLIDKFAP